MVASLFTVSSWAVIKSDANDHVWPGKQAVGNIPVSSLCAVSKHYVGAVGSKLSFATAIRLLAHTFFLYRPDVN